jgi:hypothetical protein
MISPTLCPCRSLPTFSRWHGSWRHEALIRSINQDCVHASGLEDHDVFDHEIQHKSKQCGLALKTRHLSSSCSQAPVACLIARLLATDPHYSGSCHHVQHYTALLRSASKCVFQHYTASSCTVIDSAQPSTLLSLRYRKSSSGGSKACSRARPVSMISAGNLCLSA